MMSEEESNTNNNNQDGGGQSNKRKAEELLTHQEKRQIKIETEHHNVQMFHHIVAAPEMDILQILNMQFSPGWVSNHSEIYSEERIKKRERRPPRM
mmetsp:Transcript_15855/g.31989  ORF Transcript_15855/g.31989 Transcript_15855/m.31989 type:complete len:96 (-) Transcript_15855:135-422(-)